MFFDGQNLEAHSEEDEDKIIAALQELGDLEISEEDGPTIVKVAGYSFIMQQGNMDYVTITGSDDSSDEMLAKIFVGFGGQSEYLE